MIFEFIDILSVVFSSPLSYYVFYPALAFAIIIAIFAFITRMVRP
jgi:hypothetical protein